MLKPLGRKEGATWPPLLGAASWHPVSSTKHSGAGPTVRVTQDLLVPIPGLKAENLPTIDLTHYPPLTGKQMEGFISPSEAAALGCISNESFFTSLQASDLIASSVDAADSGEQMAPGM